MLKVGENKRKFSHFDGFLKTIVDIGAFILWIFSFFNFLGIVFLQNSDCIYLVSGKLDSFGLLLYSNSLTTLVLVYASVIFFLSTIQLGWLKFRSFKKLFLFAPFVFVLCPVTFALCYIIYSGMETIPIFGEYLFLQIYYPKEVLIAIGKEVCYSYDYFLSLETLDVFADQAKGSSTKMVELVKNFIERHQAFNAKINEFEKNLVLLVMGSVVGFCLDEIPSFLLYLFKGGGEEEE